MNAETEKKTADLDGARRAVALVLGPASALLCIAVASVLIVMGIGEDRDAFIEAELLAKPREAYESNPADEKLREHIRTLDEETRSDYFYRRRLASVGGALLLAAGAALVLSLRLYTHVPISKLRPEVKKASAEDDDDLLAAARRRKLVGIGSMAAAFVVVSGLVGLLGLLGPPALTNGEGPGDDGAAGSFAENWPQFRGPTGMGLVPPGEWPSEWNGPAGTNVLWKVEVPETGKSSPAVWGDRIYLTGGDQDRQLVMCFDARDGKLLWNSPVNSPAAWKNDPAQALEDYNFTGFAAPTAVTDGRYVVAFFATADVACFDAEGRQLWARNFGRPDSMYGLAASPALDGNKVIVQLDLGGNAADKLSKLIAMDIASGRILWSTPRDVPNSWASPVVINTGERKVVLTCADPFVIAYDPADGKELWRVKGLSGDVAPAPVYADGLFFATNEGAQVMAIRQGGSGDVTKTHVKWTGSDGLPDTASPLTDGRLLLQALSYGSVYCHDAREGKLLWEAEVGTDGEGAVASPVLVGSKVYLSDKTGVTHIFELGTTYVAGTKNPLGEKIEASLAFAGGRIYIRGVDHLYCIGKKAPNGGE